jgi:hypothetical protein
VDRHRPDCRLSPLRSQVHYALAVTMRSRVHWATTRSGRRFRAAGMAGCFSCHRHRPPQLLFRSAASRRPLQSARASAARWSRPFARAPFGGWGRSHLYLGGHRPDCAWPVAVNGDRSRRHVIAVLNTTTRKLCLRRKVTNFLHGWHFSTCGTFNERLNVHGMYGHSGALTFHGFQRAGPPSSWSTKGFGWNDRDFRLIATCAVSWVCNEVMWR